MVGIGGEADWDQTVGSVSHHRLAQDFHGVQLLVLLVRSRSLDVRPLSR